MYYLLILVLLFLAELFYFRIADRYNIIDKPNERSSHTKVTLRGGGIIFYFGALAYFLTSGFEYPWFLLALTLVTFISFVDDIKSTGQMTRLLFHFSAMAMMFYQWGLFSLSWWWIVIALIVCTGIINAYNFMDGINGITGAYSLSILFPLCYLNNSIEFIDSHFLIVVMMSVGIFCIFNFRKKARCFAGDVGAVGIAFIILFLVGKLLLFTNNLTYLLLLAVYGVDSVLTIIHRILLHENIGEAHRKHVYQLMANELKIPHVVVSIIYMCLQSVVSFGLLLLPMNHWIYFMMVLPVLCVVYVWFKRKYYYLHEEYLKCLK